MPVGFRNSSEVDAALAQTVEEVDRLLNAQNAKALEDAKGRKPDL